ncbi:MAG: hypothetical protein R3B83_08910 [Nitrospirales bacterium]|nr:hypothetical protein [Nitrospira sp.]MCB9711684.1 hypothetical protein [Nitrospiraceae bacterium]MDR4487627.1 hypothetical protein [Nitrospirales bacterium]
MAKKRSLTDDAKKLKEKSRMSVKENENPEGDARVRSLRKRLKRAQRKIRMIKQRTEGSKSKKTGSDS